MSSLSQLAQDALKTQYQRHQSQQPEKCDRNSGTPRFSEETRQLLEEAGYYDDGTTSTDHSSSSTPQAVSSEFMSAAELDAMNPPMYDSYNSSPVTRAKAAELQKIADSVAATNHSAPKPIDERKRVRSLGHRERTQYRLQKGMSEREFSNWLWGDTPQQAAPSSPAYSLQWAESVLASDDERRRRGGGGYTITRHEDRRRAS